MSKHVIYPSILQPYTLFFLAIESLNFIIKVDLFKKHKEFVLSHHNNIYFSRGFN